MNGIGMLIRTVVVDPVIDLAGVLIGCEICWSTYWLAWNAQEHHIQLEDRFHLHLRCYVMYQLISMVVELV